MPAHQKNTSSMVKPSYNSFSCIKSKSFLNQQGEKCETSTEETSRCLNAIGKIIQVNMS